MSMQSQSDPDTQGTQEPTGTQEFQDQGMQEPTAPQEQQLDQATLEDLVSRRDAYIGKWLHTTNEGKAFVKQIYERLYGGQQPPQQTQPTQQPQKPKSEVEELREQIKALKGEWDGRINTEREARAVAKLIADIHTAAQTTIWGKHPESGDLIEDLIHNAAGEEDAEGLTLEEIAKRVNAGFNEIIEKIVAERTGKGQAPKQPLTRTGSGGGPAKPEQITDVEEAGKAMLDMLKKSGGMKY